MVEIKYLLNEELKFEIVVSQKIARMIVKKWYELSGRKAVFLYSDDVVNFAKTELSKIKIMKYDYKGKTVNGATYDTKRMYFECKTVDGWRLSEGENLDKVSNISSALLAAKDSMLNFAN